MAKLERTFTGDFDLVLVRLDQGVLNGSMSASLEDTASFTMGNTRVAVRMYERYSWSGSNRVALCLTLVGEGENLHLTAMTAGGSQAMFFKINTWGEEAFLDTLRDIVDKL
ncbi:MAG: hypothetical protein K2M15_09500 [Oscillospiraceae bacterium]|nr:hypothetical protein [Oscillospiraceae bacterium]MDE7171137.1 hypothetical protein [Oscillospiraceae bacterium]